MNARAPLAASLVAIMSASAAGQDLYVDADALPGGNGTSWAEALPHLQDALAAAIGPTEIWVAEGTYRPDLGSGNRAASFSLVDGIAVYGGFVGNETLLSDRDPEANPTILDGDLLGNDIVGFVNNEENSYNVVTCMGSTGLTIIDGFIVRNGNSDGSPFGFVGGAGLLAEASVVSVAGCLFETNDGNAASFGKGSSATVQSCVFDGNRSDSGGGLISSKGSIMVTNCKFSNNAATNGDGGGAYISLNTLTQTGLVQECRFEDNDASFRGGGLFTISSFSGGSNTISVVGCVMRNNSAVDGGGSYHFGQGVNDLVEIGDCRYEANMATNTGPGGAGSGGGIASRDLGLTVYGAVFDRNAARRGGGYSDESNEYSRVYNCRFTGNVALSNDGGGMWTSTIGVTLANVMFSGNQTAAWGGGAMVAILSPNEHPLLSNVVCYGNSASVAGGLWIGDDQTELSNAVLWSNLDSSGGGQSAQLTGSPIINYSCVESWDGSLGGTGNFGLDPGLTNPTGCDGILGTVDDDLRPTSSSPCLDAGSATKLPQDLADLDNDGDTTEKIPLDLDLLDREVGVLDLGTYEWHGILPTVYCTAKINSLGCVPSICSSGRASLTGVDEFEVHAMNVRSNERGVLIWSLSSQAHPFGGGVLCIQAPTKSIALDGSGGNPGIPDCSGTYTYLFSQQYMISQMLGPGTRIYAQFMSWDSGWSSPPWIGLTDALEFEIAP